MSSAPVFVDFHALAAAEYRRARRYYARAGNHVAARFIAAVDAAIQQITAFPLAGSPASRRCRRVRVARFLYTLIYRQVNPAWIEIVAVAHTSRRPGYWSRRVP